MKHIKVSFPASEQEFNNNTGEGMFVIVDDKTYDKILCDTYNEKLIGILDNTSFCVPWLTAGTEVEFYTRGEMRPVAHTPTCVVKEPDTLKYRNLVKQVTS